MATTFPASGTAISDPITYEFGTDIELPAGLTVGGSGAALIAIGGIAYGVGSLQVAIAGSYFSIAIPTELNPARDTLLPIIDGAKEFTVADLYEGALDIYKADSGVIALAQSIYLGGVAYVIATT